MTQTIALFDQRPFFEKALVYGVEHGILTPAKLEAIQTDAPKGMVQIARYFGSEFLRPELEKAKERLVNLVSLTLEIESDGDLGKAAQSLRDHSFLSRSKAASDRLKALIVMPQSTHFGMNESGGFSDSHLAQLAKWSLCSLADYQAEWTQRQQVAHVIHAAIWFATNMGLDVNDLEESGCDAEAVIRTALLAAAVKHKHMPDWPTFQKIMVKLRKFSSPAVVPLAVPKNLPAEFAGVVHEVRQSVIADLPQILDSQRTPHKLFHQTPSFVGRYFWIEDGWGEMGDWERQT